MSLAVKVAFDPSCRYSPRLDQLQDVLGSRYEIIETTDPEFVFYGPFSMNLKQKLKSWWYEIRRKRVRRIFWTGENARPDFERFDWCVTFDYDDIVQHSRHIRRPVCPQLPELFQPRKFAKEELLERKFCNFLYSQPNRVRENFFDCLNRYRRVDSPGARKNNMSALGNQDSPIASRIHRSWSQQRLEFVRQYKFTIAFENSSYPGYITEKMWQTLLGGSLPIYWGNPMAYRDFNPKCYINVHDFSSLQEAADWVCQVDRDEALYLSYFEAAATSSENLARHWHKYREGLQRMFSAPRASGPAL